MTETTERLRLDAMQPYVLLAVSTFITAGYKANFSPFLLLQRPQVHRASVAGGRVDFELPDWLPVEECLLSAPGGELHAFVKHLPLRRATDTRSAGARTHTIELPPGRCAEGSVLTLTYFAWFRFAAPPFDFNAEEHVACYVAAALQHRCRSLGLHATLELQGDTAVLHLTDRLFMEIVGKQALSEVSVVLDHLDTSFHFHDLRLTVSREMFPDLYAAAAAARAAGETFRGVMLDLEDNQFLLQVAPGRVHVQT